MKTRSLILLSGFCLGSLMVLAQQPGDQTPTLADIARQKRAEKAKKVFTSEDMKAAEPAPAPAPAAEASDASEAAPAGAPKSSEEVAAAEAKVADLRDREILLNRNIVRYEGSLLKAQEEQNEDRVRTFGESLEAAKTALAENAEKLKAAEKELRDMRAAAAAAAATKKKPAKKPAAPKS